MAGLHGATIPPALAEIRWHEAYYYVVALLALVWLAPNTVQIFRTLPETQDDRNLEDQTPSWLMVKWQANRWWAYSLAFLAVASLANMTEISEFLYFRF